MLGNTERLGLWLAQRFLPLPVDTETNLHVHGPLAPSLCRRLLRYYGHSAPSRRFPTLALAGLLLERLGWHRRGRFPRSLNCCVTDSCHLNAGGHGVRNRHRPRSSRVNDSTTVWSRSYAFDTSSVVHLRSSLGHPSDRFFPDLFLLCSRPWLLATAAEGDLRPAPVSRPEGLLSLISCAVTHGPSSSACPALVAHNRPRTGSTLPWPSALVVPR